MGTRLHFLHTATVKEDDQQVIEEKIQDVEDHVDQVRNSFL